MRRALMIGSVAAALVTSSIFAGWVGGEPQASGNDAGSDVATDVGKAPDRGGEPNDGGCTPCVLGSAAIGSCCVQ
jgi:hypothetical protein